MEIQKVEIEKLKIAEYNPRKDLTEKDPEYQKIKNSIIEFGYVSPIIINQDNTVVGGHQRLKVLQELGYKEIECVIVEFDKNREKALNIALNKITGEWDYQKLETLFNELANADLDLSVTGFDDKEIDRFIKETEEAITENAEVNLLDFSDEKFKCQCPKCGFMFDVNK